METGKCALCLADGELCQSHIIPEFNYKELYDDKHRFIRLSASGPKHKRFDQKGYREPLLCRSCENHFSKWERYARDAFQGNGVTLVNQNQYGLTLEGLDYEKFRLYGLSILWRMGVSQLEMFSVVNLGPHEERLRQALLASDPLSPEMYPFIMAGVVINGRFQSDLIVPPSLDKSGGEHIYRPVISGLLHFFHVASHPTDANLRDMAVTEEGRLKIPMCDISEIEFLKAHMLEVHKAAKDANAI